MLQDGRRRGPAAPSRSGPGREVLAHADRACAAARRRSARTTTRSSPSSGYAEDGAAPAARGGGRVKPSIQPYGLVAAPSTGEVVRGLRLKRLSFELHEPGAPEDYRRQESRDGAAAALETDGERVHDSTAILLRLDARGPGARVVASDPRTAAAKRRLEEWRKSPSSGTGCAGRARSPRAPPFPCSVPSRTRARWSTRRLRALQSRRSPRDLAGTTGSVWTPRGSAGFGLARAGSRGRRSSSAACGGAPELASGRTSRAATSRTRAPVAHGLLRERGGGVVADRAARARWRARGSARRSAAARCAVDLEAGDAALGEERSTTVASSRIDSSRLRAISGHEHVELELAARAPPTAIAASLPITCAATCVTDLADHRVHLAGHDRRARLERGQRAARRARSAAPTPSSRTSFAILKSATASVAQRAARARPRRRARPAPRSGRRPRGTRARSRAESRAIARAAKPGGR